MYKKNCWECKKCGRQPGGEKAAELGVCPVTTLTEAHGINSGINGGRVCWATEGTLCGGEVQGTFARKMSGCFACDFYEQVRQEEGLTYKNTKKILEELSNTKKQKRR